MTSRYRMIVITASLAALAGLTLVMLNMGQSAAAITTLIAAIILGVQQLVQAFNGPPTAGRVQAEPGVAVPTSSHTGEAEANIRGEDGQDESEEHVA